MSPYTDAQPKAGSTQPGLAALAAEAMQGPVRRRLTEGIIYSTGNELHDMYAEAVLDMEERYLFTALKPESRFGTGRVEFVTFDCGQCGKSFEARWVKRRCESCKEPFCTWCGRCECDPTNTGRSCGRCFEVLTPEEVATGLHECP